MNKRDIQIVADCFREAILTIRKLPPVKVKDYVNSCPDIKYAVNKLMSQERLNLVLQANPEEIIKLEQTFEWMRCIDTKESKLIWLRAARIPWKVVCLEFGYSEVTLWRRRNYALQKICKHLNISS